MIYTSRRNHKLADGERMSYLEYVNGLSLSVSLNSLHIPSDHHDSLNSYADEIGINPQTVSQRLKLLLLPEQARGWVDKAETGLSTA